MVRGWDRYPLLSRPISVHDADEKTVSFLYEVRGEGTKLLAQKRNGEEIELFGPLGSGFPTEKIVGKVAVVSGGIGIAPLLYLVKNLVGCEIHLFCGFREKSYETGAFKPFVKDIQIATDSGKQGHKGFVTDLFDPADFDMVLCCGPEVMMEKTARDAIKKQVPCLLSMERHMACGVGACLGCTVKTAGGAKCICKEGPVFWGEELYA
jgi:dihydroorotate dehydrogenase electron transfer subunit